MMTLLFFVSCSENKTAQSLTSTCHTGSDSIDRLVQKLNSDIGGLWINGTYPIIRLPANAKAEEVLAQAVKMTGFDKGNIKTYKIRKVRRIKLNAIGMENCSVALVESDLGTKIFLFRYEGKTSWWTRFYDASDNKTKQ